MIMLSATPHDGSPRSFASLMNMLDPTAIANPDHYTRNDIEGLFIRRFKGYIKHQVDTAFQERDVEVCEADTTALEEAAYEALAGLDFAAIDAEGSGDIPFKTTLEKALLPSPAACLETIENRIEHLERKDESVYQQDIQQLERFAERLRPIGPGQFSKYQRLLALLQDPASGVAWDGTDPQDRLVIFSERLETLRFLEKCLARDLDLGEGAIDMLHGGMSDVDQQEVVERFGKDEADVRLLLASDIAAEGIDRYGQRTPTVYIRTMVMDETLDVSIMKVLVRKAVEIRRQHGFSPPYFGEETDILELLHDHDIAIGPKQLTLFDAPQEATDEPGDDPFSTEKLDQIGEESFYGQTHISLPDIEERLEQTKRTIGSPEQAEQFVRSGLRRAHPDGVLPCLSRNGAGCRTVRRK